MGVTLLLVMVNLLAVGMIVTGPLDQERRKVREDPVRGLGDESGGVATHHVGDGHGDLMAFARIETCSTGMADLFAESMSPSVYTRGVRGDGCHVGGSADCRCDGCSGHGFGKGKLDDCGAGE
jgi:hypothetical protein